ncbi:hypothetical protein K1719_001554 [Acacia pycnantha]|nr:hypothetical protein K1719_001554 [Acacia pycnantha]
MQILANSLDNLLRRPFTLMEHRLFGVEVFPKVQGGNIMVDVAHVVRQWIPVRFLLSFPIVIRFEWSLPRGSLAFHPNSIFLRARNPRHTEKGLLCFLVSFAIVPSAGFSSEVFSGEACSLFVFKGQSSSFRPYPPHLKAYGLQPFIFNWEDPLSHDEARCVSPSFSAIVTVVSHTKFNLAFLSKNKSSPLLFFVLQMATSNQDDLVIEMNSLLQEVETIWALEHACIYKMPSAFGDSTRIALPQRWFPNAHFTLDIIEYRDVQASIYMKQFCQRISNTKSAGTRAVSLSSLLLHN